MAKLVVEVEFFANATQPFTKMLFLVAQEDTIPIIVRRTWIFCAYRERPKCICQDEEDWEVDNSY
jgi:hypothetical protein